MESLTISTPLSKRTGFEDSEMSAAYFEDLKGRNNDAISNEMIRKGDPVLDTYKVTSDAIPGGMGCVWRVHHNGWDADLAMKRPHPRFFSESSDRTKKQFVEECDNWINLGLHPNIVSCYYVREIGGVPTIFSEWMENGSLRDRMKDGSLYEGSEEQVQERILNIAIQAANGLQYSHENNLVHQDMKPDNLLLTKEWGAKVADFGIAKAKSGLGEASGTVKVSGYTLPYCPAEQKNGEEPARWMDIYAWALTVLEMYAGKLLWSSGAEAKDHFDEYPAQCAHAVPDQLKTLLKSCLTDRPDSFDGIKKDLIALYSEVTGREYPDPGFTGNTDSAENLNNRALSFLDLRQEDDAEKCWEAALSRNPDHTESVINQILFKWYYDRFGLGRSYIIDQYAVSSLKSNNHNDIYSVTVLLSVSILRCQREDALTYLDSLEALGEKKEICAKFRTLIEEKCPEPKLLRSFPEKEIPIAATKDGDVAVLNETRDAVRIVSVLSGRNKGDFRFTHHQKIDFAVFNEAGTLLALCGGGLTVWDVTKRKKLFQDTDQDIVFAVFNEQNQQIAAVCDDLDQGGLYDLGSGKKVCPIITHSILDVPEYKLHLFEEKDGELSVAVPNSESFVDCLQDEEGQMHYSFYPCRFRDYSNSQVIYREKDSEIPILTKFTKPSLQLNTGLRAQKTESGYEVYQVPAPDLAMLPHMELSKIHSILEQIREKDEYLSAIAEAEQLTEEGNYAEALKRIDTVLALKNYEHDSRALALRHEIDAHMKNKTFLKCIELRDYDETLPDASPGTYPEAPQEILEKAENCLSIEDAQADNSGNLMAAIFAKAASRSDYPIQKVYCTANEHIFICIGWKHERKTVGRTPDYDPIIQDSTEYRLSLYDDSEDKLRVFPPFSSARFSEMYLEEDRGYKYQMFVAYNEEYHRLVGGNEDYDTPRVTWDTESQTQVAEVDQITSSLLLLSNPRYYLTSGERTMSIVDLKDNAIVWTDSVTPGRQIKYKGNVQFDREKDIVRFEMSDGSYMSVQILWSYEAEEEAPENVQEAPEAPEAVKEAPEKKSTVDATLYSDDAKNFIVLRGVLKNYTGKKTQLMIPETVSVIGDGVFSGNESIESVVIPEGVKRIGGKAFEGCRNLKDITIPESMEYIGDYAFSGCESLRKIVIPDRVTEMGEGVFSDCSVLSSVKLPDDLECISRRMFMNCSFLMGIFIPESVSVIGEEAFKNCIFMRRITIPEEVTVIEKGAFEGCRMMDAIEDLSSDLETIGDDAFNSCGNLSYVSLSYAYQLKHIGNRAFRDCRKLSSIHIPSTVETIGDEAFYGCSIDGDINIPEGVKHVGKNAFGEAENPAPVQEKQKEEPVKHEPVKQDTEKHDTGQQDTEKKAKKGGFFSRLFGGRK